LACSAGKSLRDFQDLLSSPVSKNILISRNCKSVYILVPSRSDRGALAIVTDVERDAVDADAPITNGVEADGEGVWSRCPDAGIKFLGSRLFRGDGGKKARSPRRARYKP
jgi:hypothetical protein